jgi:hypothetical protein
MNQPPSKRAFFSSGIIVSFSPFGDSRSGIERSQWLPGAIFYSISTRLIGFDMEPRSGKCQT